MVTTTAPPATAIGYCRVSTDQQGDRGYGLAAQRALIEAEFARRGVTGKIYVDVASGKSLQRRGQLVEALEQLAGGNAEVLVVAKLDRLSRSLLDFASLMATSQQQGWGIVALDIGVDTSTINGELVANIIMALAQWERRIIGKRTSEALAEVRAKGTRLGRPRGVSDDTAAMIRVLRDQGLGFQRIANILNDQGVPTGQGGARWYASTVRSVTARNLGAAAGDGRR